MTKAIKFPKLVIEEAKNLKKFATPEEIDNLKWYIDPEDAARCIYGRMTGNCYSERAEELIKKSCSRVYLRGPGEKVGSNAKINGSPKKHKKRYSGLEAVYYSPIEVFISRTNRETLEKLVAFIRGEHKKLI